MEQIKDSVNIEKRLKVVDKRSRTGDWEGEAILAKEIECGNYFAHPYASWERGTNENTNRLIKQYFPKGTHFNQVTDEQVKYAMDRLNNRPRKIRGNQSANELFGAAS